MSGKTFTKRLREEHLMFSYGNWPGENDGVYISPNVFNSAKDMSALVAAVKVLAASA